MFGGLNSLDVELLLDLLAETMGLAPAMRILTILDPELHNAWKIKHSEEVRKTPIKKAGVMAISNYMHLFRTTKSPTHV